ncbi:MAG: hybrid sensor histidine kinase/response regulator [Aphanothece sp. CMT-3BRIN-NPC111]|jgi:chemosensory pili system protein ChpA (sensor histidine kinase/response regulator)|nr:hybrid sensor histidine kinase/response regulator [Aphanothece sp. CMT-3BRIN-NPC111]
MSQDKEAEIRLQFLEEAQDYLNTIESVLLELDLSRIKEQMDAALRAAHSIKGGAGMMGFEALSQLAHRLEDSFKVLKAQKESLDDELSSQLLMAVDYMRQVIALYLKGKAIEEQWLAIQVNPVLDSLYERLGDPQVEDFMTEMPEDGQDMITLLFQTEVEGCLQRLESVLADPEKPCLLEECSILAQELSGLGEMLELHAFSSLCNSVSQHLETAPEQVEEIATLALQLWRRSQALVLVGQIDSLPSELNLKSVSEAKTNSHAPEKIEDIFNEQIDLAHLSPTNDNLLLDLFSLTEDSTNLAAALSTEDIFNLEVESPTATTNDDLADVLGSLAIPNITAAEPIVPEILISPKSDIIPTVEPKIVSSAPSGLKAESTPAAHVPEKQENTVRVPVKQLDDLNDLFGELTISRNSLDIRLGRLRKLVSLLSRRVQVLEKSNVQLGRGYDKVATQAAMVSGVPSLVAAALPKKNTQHQNSQPQNSFDALNSAAITDSTVNGRFDILEMDQYNDLHLLSQEVMETLVQIQEVTTDIELSLEDTDQTARELNRTSKQLQSSLTQVRMRPLFDVVGRFPRVVRDLSLQYGKSVELKMYGSATLIDRTILEALSDPLMHLLRNGFDHGIEPPATRQASGKPSQGTIEIRAAYRGNQTLITISDDGGGIDLEKIREKAQKMGLDAAELASASDKELLELIFEPGFTTAEKVTSLSGRGVGMDVVRTNLKQVRGDIKVDTELGVGTTFTISVPFTLSVMRVLLVESNGMLLAFPRDAIEEMILPESDLLLTSGESQVLNWEDYLVPLVHLSQWLEFNCPHKTVDAEATPSINEPTVLIVTQGSQLFGIKTDRCWGEQEVTIRQVEGTISLPSGLAGCAVLGDGRIAPLVDISALLSWLANSSKSSSLNGTPQRRLAQLGLESGRLGESGISESQRNKVLIIDDSINVRRFLALTLEKAGYEVEQAKDGQDALDKLIGGLEVQVVICDIEMPRLDGYGFLGRLKSYPAFRELPVAMLTSRSGDKHRRLAMDLGAKAYFSKPYKEQELLQTLKQLLQNQPQPATL